MDESVRPNRHRRLSHCLALGLLAGLHAEAQTYNFTTWSVEDGLAQSQVAALLQDRRGDLWVATLGGGVSRFDGFEFQTFTTADGLPDDTVSALHEDRQGRLWVGTASGLGLIGAAGVRPMRPNALGDAHVRALQEDEDGRLWVGTERGAAVLDGATWYGVDPAAGRAVRAIFQDSTGDVWIGSLSGLLRLDARTCGAWPVPPGLPETAVYTVFEDRRGVIWIGTGRGAFFLEGDRFRRLDAGPLGGVKAFVEDRAGSLWIATDQEGVFRLDPGRGTLHLTEKEGLPSNTIWALLEDREGQIWLGTYRGGLSRFDGEAFVHYTASELGDDVVRTILEDRQGRLVFGTYRGGVTFFDGRAFSRRSEPDGLVDNFVLSAFADRRGDLWLGTLRGLSRYDGSTFEEVDLGIAAPTVRDVLEDRRGVLWIATDAHGLVRLDGDRITRTTTAEGLPDDEVLDLAEDASGRVWVATSRGAVQLAETGLLSVSGEHPFLAGEVYSILPTAGGELWFAVYGAGVLHCAQESAALRCTSFERRDGLLSHAVVSLIEDAAGDLRIGSERGIYRLDVATYRDTGEKRLRFFGKAEGFRGIECVHNAVHRDARGRLWFGTIRGATVLDPALLRPGAAAPLVHITGLRIFLEAHAGVAQRSVQVLEHDQNHVTFDYRGSSLRSPEKLSYQVQLQGFDRAGLPVGAQRHVTYSNLPPGDYQFQVAARDGDGRHSDAPATYRFRIRRPFWATWWFRLIALAAGVFGLVSAHRLRVRAMSRREEELEREVEARAGLIRRQKSELEKKNTELESFTYRVSHDLRSPLFTLKGFLAMLEKDVAAGRLEQVCHDMSRLHDAADHMAELLSGLLKLSRAGRVIDERQECFFRELAEETVAVLTGSLDARGVRLEIEVGDTVVVGDRARLRQVLQNLIENAVKFMGDEPDPVVRIGMRHDPGGESVFFVEDNGIGIERDEQVRIFELFERAPSKGENTGIGLAVVKKIIEVHGGRVWIESEGRQRGSRVCFTIPS